MQLTDEPDKRCYPLDDHLFCRNCHLRQLGGIQPPNFEVRTVMKPTGGSSKSIPILFG